MQVCEIHGAECGAEILLPADDAAAAAEISTRYDGLVLKEAIRIVCHRNRLTKCKLSKILEVSEATFYHHANGHPIRRSAFNTEMVRLVIFEQERMRDARS